MSKLKFSFLVLMLMVSVSASADWAPINFIILLYLLFHEFPLAFFHVHTPILSERHALCLQQSPLFRPARCQPALAVHYPMAGQTHAVGHIVHSMSHHARTLRSSDKIGYLSVRHHPPRRDCGHYIINLLLKSVFVHKSLVWEGKDMINSAGMRTDVTRKWLRRADCMYR